MLKRFEVRNYKHFKETMILDLGAGKFSGKKYNQSLVKDKLAKLSVIYGANESGKTSLCTGLVDLTSHLLNVARDSRDPYLYTNLENNSEEAEFKYTFQFGKDEVQYHYRKKFLMELTFESLTLNGKELIHYNFNDDTNNFIKIKGTEKLNTKNLRNDLSIVKYIYNNSNLDESSIIVKLMNYVSGMLFLRDTHFNTSYIGYTNESRPLSSMIIKKNKLKEFQDFLEEFDIHYNLVKMDGIYGNYPLIGAKFDNDVVVPLSSLASSGTNSLTFLYGWFLEFGKLTFLVMDDFGSYYHPNLAVSILKKISKFSNLQTIAATHDISILGSDMTRPDCAFIIDENGTKSLADRSEKPIRENNSIEKMYRDGNFEDRK